MANKLTKEKIDLLIEQVLDEKKISIDLKGLKKTAAKNKASNDLKVPKNTWTELPPEEFAQIKRPYDQIDDDDFEQAFSMTSRSSKLKQADLIQQKTKNTEIWDTLSSLGGTDGNQGLPINPLKKKQILDFQKQQREDAKERWELNVDKQRTTVFWKSHLDSIKWGREGSKKTNSERAKENQDADEKKAKIEAATNKWKNSTIEEKIDPTYWQDDIDEIRYGKHTNKERQKIVLDYKNEQFQNFDKALNEFSSGMSEEEKKELSVYISKSPIRNPKIIQLMKSDLSNSTFENMSNTKINNIDTGTLNKGHIKTIVNYSVSLSDEQKDKFMYLYALIDLYSDFTSGMPTYRKEIKFLKYKDIEASNLEAVEMSYRVFDLKKIDKIEPFTTGSDVIDDPEIMTTAVSSLPPNIQDKALNFFVNKLKINLGPDEYSRLAPLGQKNDINEVVNPEEIVDISDFVKLLGIPDEDLEASLKAYKEDPKNLKLALKNTYKDIVKATHTDIGVEPEDFKKVVRALADGTKKLIDAIDYYKSGRVLRTKSGPTTGFKIGTAQTSGTARVEKELVNVFSKISPNADVKQKFVDLSEYLKKINESVKQESYEFQGKISDNFSRYVALEILSDNLYMTEEATVKGNLFEAFLAMFLGGTQVGGERGGADFILGDIKGSAKLQSSTKFKQANQNLQEPLLYVVALKVSISESGQKKLASESDRITAVDIYLFDVVPDESKRVEGKDLPSEHIYCYPHGSKEESKKIIGSSVKTTSSEEGSQPKTETQFETKSILRDSYVATLDFSFMAEGEFTDFSSKILKSINDSVEKAFSSLTNLKNNITRWINDKDLIAANQVDYNQDDLSSAIEGLKGEDELKSDKLSETKSLKELDKLIERVILNKMNKL